ncbi:MAG: PepSY-associated TM helix domain-containing protein [Bacteroidales bacterium]|nr:PepSY-associated TM helix domain-containing protein [Bacteroidales bacterium]
MNIRKLNRAVHRDLGYFFFGMAIIYGLSGIALNHRHHWNPNYIITQESYQLEKPSTELSGKNLSLHFLEQLDEEDNYRTQIVTGSNLRIFIEGGSINVDLVSGNANLEKIRKRPVFHEVNFLHYNTPRKLWTWFSDAFAAGLIILAITGLFVLKGKNGITRRGAWITSAGVIIPIVLLYLYLNA